MKMKSDRELLESILLGKTDDLADTLARASFDEKRRAVFWAASAGNSAALEAIARSIEPEARRTFFSILRDGRARTPLHVALTKPIAWQLWKLGCSPTAKDGGGQTPAERAQYSVNFALRDFLGQLEKNGHAERPDAEPATLDLCVEAEATLWTNLEATNARA